MKSIFVLRLYAIEDYEVREQDAHYFPTREIAVAWAERRFLKVVKTVTTRPHVCCTVTEHRIIQTEE